MRLIKIALTIGVLALVAGPAALAMGKPEGVPPGSATGNEPTGEGGSGTGHGTEQAPGEQAPGPKAGLPEKAKAYGRYCNGKSKKHENGEKGTEFSRCVTAMAKAATHEHMAPGRACKGESRKHEKGEKGTPFSRCVKSVAHLRRDEKKQQREEEREGS
jgi:hypothetical protein